MSIDKTSTPAEDHAVENPDAASAAATVVDPRLLVREQGLTGYLGEFKRKMKAGDLGSIPVVVGLLIIWAIFTSLNSNFLTAGNFSDMSVAMVGTGMIAVGIVFVLLLGEIDLSVGSVSGVAGATFAVLNITHGMNEVLALVLAILTGTVAGAIHGFFFARIGVPAFAVTLAGLLFWQGFMLQILGSNGTINLNTDGIVVKLTSYYFSDVAAAYGLAIVVTAGYFLSAFFDNRRRERQRRAVPAAERDHRPHGTARDPGLRRGDRLQPVQGPAAGRRDLPRVPAAHGLRTAPYRLRPQGLRARRQRRERPAVPVSTSSWSGSRSSRSRHLRRDRRSLRRVEDRLRQPGRGHRREFLMNVIAAAVIGGTSLFGGAAAPGTRCSV